MVVAGRLDERFMTPIVRPGVLGTSILIALFITALFQQFFRTKARQIQAENRATEAQLRLLQAQIEPHFLFNTLANVVCADGGRPAAREGDARIVRRLPARLALRPAAGDHTLGDEIDLVDAYLRIIKIRMEDGSRTRSTCPTSCAASTCRR